MEPFFNQTIDALTQANAVQKLTPLEALLDVPTRHEPQGFVFHVSRCGSTLVSRSLAAVPRHRVISEATPVNRLLLAENLDPQMKGQLLKGLVHALCGTAENTACIIKFTSWNLLFLAEIRALFPTVPWVFIYREPIDVIQSLMARPPRWASNQVLTRLIENSGAEGSEQMIGILENIYQAPLPHMDKLARVVNYSQLPAAILDIAIHFDLDLDAVAQEKITQMGQYDSKNLGKIKFQARESKPISNELGTALFQLNALYKQWEQISIGSESVHVR